MREMDANTNKVYRKKYFMNADKVVFSEEFARSDVEDEALTLIAAEAVQMTDHSVPITHGMQDNQDCIQVETIVNGDRIEKLIIKCPCGRTTELDVQYQAETLRK